MNIMRFENESESHIASQEKSYPIKVWRSSGWFKAYIRVCSIPKVEYNPEREEMLICTRRDVRVADISTGRVQKIFQGLLKESREIATFTSLNAYHNFIIADQLGNLSLHAAKSAEFLGALNPHSAELS